MSAQPPLSFTIVPWSSIVWGLLGLPLIIGAALVPGAELGARLAGAGFGGMLVVIAVLVIRKRWATLTIGDQITYRRLSVQLAVPLTSAQRVTVERRLSIHRPTFWDLVVHVNGTDVRLPLGAHIGYGAPLHRRAQAVAGRLGLPIVDPMGDVWRNSRFVPLRLLAAGHDWLFFLGAVVVTAPVLVGLGLLISRL